MESNDLKEQFQTLQDKQQQKLLERRKKREQTNKNKKKTPEATGPAGKFGISDDLGLKLAEPPDKGYGYVSEELVDHLNNQIRELKDENGRVYKLLSERDFEVRQMKKKMEENKGASDDVPVTNETAATKIIELSKKVRELTADKEAEKTRCKQYQKKCYDLQLQLQNQPQQPLGPDSKMGSMISLQSQPDNKSEDGVNVKALQDRLKQSESRVTDYRNQCQTLRQELKIAQKVLSQEVGEHVDITHLTSEKGNWRGRAQQILALQQKVEELKFRLEKHQSDENDGENGLGRKRQEEKKYRDELKRMETERKKAQENDAARLKAVEEENKTMKEKLDASKARIKVLSNDVKSQKSQVQTLLKKSRNDDEFIDALMKQQGQMKQLLDEHNKHQNQQSIVQQQQLQHLSQKSQQDNNIVEQLKAIAAQKEQQVKMLEMELQHLKMGYNVAQPSSMVSENSHRPPSNTAATVRLGASSSLDSSRPTTASTVEVNSARPPRDMTFSALNTERTMSRSSSRVSHTLGQGDVGAKINEKELADLRYQIEELSVMGKAMEVERDRLAELVKVLQQRLAAETERLSDAQAEIQAHKRTSVELEKKLGRQNLEWRRKGTARGLSASRDVVEDEKRDEDDDDLNELMTKLEIQQDENVSLKAALQRTLKAKEEDLNVYSSTLEETKKVFLQALRQMKEKQTGS